MELADTRYANYRSLLEEFSRLEQERDLPRRGELGRFAAFTGISAKYLSHINARKKQLGVDSVTKMERAFGKPKGFLSQRPVFGMDDRRGVSIGLNPISGQVARGNLKDFASP